MNAPSLLVIPPEYFPTALTAACMLRAQEIVLLDTVQYSRQSFQNRTLIRNPDGVQWLTVPVRSGQFGDPIDRTRIDVDSGWRGRHEKALRFNYSTAPFYLHFRPHLDAILDGGAGILADVTCSAMRVAAELLGCEAPVERASGMPGRPSTVTDVLDALGDRTLLLPASAAEPHRAGGTRVTCSFTEIPWRQNFEGFVSGTGSLDLLFNLGPEARAHLLKNSRLDAAAAI